MSDILPIANRPGFYLIRSESDSERWYEVNRSGSCTCNDYAWRRAGSYDLCKHGRALKAYLEAQAACPACGGRGRFLLRTIMIDGEPAAIECATCSGSGSRQAADPTLLAAEDRYRAEQENDELLDIFR